MSSISRTELENWLNGYLNINAINDYLPNGLQVEGSDSISKIITAVSINLDVIDEAIKKDAKAIIVHHGLFWKTDDPRITLYRKSRIKALLQNEINLFAYHLPLDIHTEISHNRLILKGIGVTDDNIKVPSIETGLEYGLIGTFEKTISFAELVKRLNRTLKANSRYFKYGKDDIKNVAVVSGAGRTMLDKIITMNVDAYITGDAQENTEYISKEMGMNYIYAGHYNTEKPGIIALGEKIKGKFNIDVEFIGQENTL